jgi:iron complex outermembrane recepter protein
VSGSLKRHVWHVIWANVDLGGIINLVTKKPKEIAAYSVQQQFGSYNYYRTTASATGPLSAANKLFYSVDLTYQDAGSFRNNVSDNRYIVTPMLSWRPSEDTEANLTYQHRELKPIYDPGISRSEWCNCQCTY